MSLARRWTSTRGLLPAWGEVNNHSTNLHSETRHFNISFVNFKCSDLPGHHILLIGRHVFKGFHRHELPLGCLYGTLKFNSERLTYDCEVVLYSVMFPQNAHVNVSSFTFRCNSRYLKCSTLTNERISLRFWDTYIHPECFLDFYLGRIQILSFYSTTSLLITLVTWRSL